MGEPVAVSASVARQTWRTLEPIHREIYFAPEATQAYGELGLDGMRGYFASRAAPMGPVPAEVVVATFFNFNPDLVASAIPAAWTLATPEQVLAARHGAATRMLERLLGGITEAEDLEEAVVLARLAAEAAASHPGGRPLFAGHAALSWPDEPMLALWHAQSLLREFRGDGHIAALVAEEVDGIEALVIHAATGEVPAAALMSTRAWSESEWSAAEDRLRDRGWLGGPGELTPEGRAHRERVEARTDELARVAYEPLGEDGCARLRELCRPWSRHIVASGSVGFG